MREFQPRPMQLAVFTAALQELTPRDERDADPDLAIEEWLEVARRLHCPHIQMSAALPPSHASGVPGPCGCAAGGAAGSRREHARPAAAVRPAACGPGTGRHERHWSGPFGSR